MKNLPVAKVALIAFFSVIIIAVVFNFVKYIYQGDRKNINNIETKNFVSAMINTDKNIQKAKIYTQNATLQFDYTLKNEPTKDELATIFDKSYNFLMTNEKCKNLVLGFYKQVDIKIYYKDDLYMYEGRNFVDSKNSIANSSEEDNWILTKNRIGIDKFKKDNKFQ